MEKQDNQWIVLFLFIISISFMASVVITLIIKYL